MPGKCYLCDLDFNDSLVLKHGDHVKQNAIGGALISEEILSENCGSKLGTTVDKQFLLALAPITLLLDPPRDRGELLRPKQKL